MWVFLLGCGGEPYAEDPESFRGWCDPISREWHVGDRPWYATTETVQDEGCLTGWTAIEDTEGCTLWRMDEPAQEGSHDLDCVDFQVSVLGGTAPLDLSGLTPPELVETGDCGVGLAAEWLPPDAWERGVVVELQVGAQIWFFTNRSVTVWPDSGGSVAVRVIGPDGAAVEFEELGEWECVHSSPQ